MQLRIPLLLSAIIMFVIGLVLIFDPTFSGFIVYGIILVIIGLLQGSTAFFPSLRRILLLLSILCAIIALALVLMGVDIMLFLISIDFMIVPPALPVGFIPGIFPIILTLIGLGLANALMSSATLTIYYKYK